MFRGSVWAALPFALCVGSWTAPAVADQANDATIAARQRFFGAENVDETGRVTRDRVVFSWVTNASLAVSLRGRIVLLDTYINRPELPPPPGEPDLRRSPINVQELIDLHPEAIFLGHGHGDHANNAAYVAKWLNIPIYSSPETCNAMQADVQRMFNDPNTVNGGVKLIPNGNPVTCIPVVSPGSGAARLRGWRRIRAVGRGTGCIPREMGCRRPTAGRLGRGQASGTA
jgi:glyoxylase-like metal-dependent hydrolase (beta-lactamase superfamily II)